MRTLTTQQPFRLRWVFCMSALYSCSVTAYRFHSCQEGGKDAIHTLYKSPTLFAPHRHEKTRHTEEEPLFDFAMAFVGVQFTCE